MAEYIDRDALIKHYRELLCNDCDKRKGMKNGKLKFVYKVGEAPCRSCWVEDMIECVDDAPAADVRPVVHGKWIKTKMFNDEYSWVCSVCACAWNLDEGTPEENSMNLCPNCGAVMRGETNG